MPSNSAPTTLNDTRHRVLSRRGFLLGSASLAPVGLAISGLQAATPEPQPIFFTAAEFACVSALVDRLIPQDVEGPGALALGVPGFIDSQMMLPYGQGDLWFMHAPFVPAAPQFGVQLPFGPRDIYRHGIAALDRHTQATLGSPFARLALPQQEAIMSALEHGKIELEPVPATVFFGQLWTNTKEGYFSDPVHGGNRNMGSWAMIGFPGARADFTDWVDRYGARYPFGPVALSDLAPAKVPVRDIPGIGIRG